MRRFRSMFALLLLIPLSAFLVVASGCGGGDKPKERTRTAETDDDDSGSGKKAAVAATGVGTLKGRAIYEGDPPKPEDLKEREDFKASSDRSFCLKGPTTGQSWIVGPDKGVANVVVFLKPPANQFFNVPEDRRNLEGQEVAIDQPYCAFEPHVVVLFPQYIDSEGKPKPTKQKFLIRNSAPINHNTKWGGTRTINPGENITLQGRKEGDKAPERQLNVRPDPQAITLACDIHKWMNAYAWAFDHPYAAVTKEDGSYEIKDAPAGAEVFVVAWHEGSYLLPEGSPSNAGQKITLKPGETTTLDIKLSKK